MEDRSQIWMRLSPDALGDYSNGSWRFTAPMSIPRLFFASNIVRNTRLIVIGGEYSGIGLQPNWTRTGEAYNPATDTWQSHSRRIRNRSLAMIPLFCWTAIAFSPVLYLPVIRGSITIRAILQGREPDSESL